MVNYTTLLKWLSCSFGVSGIILGLNLTFVVKLSLYFLKNFTGFPSNGESNLSFSS